jgi:nicotinamide phosphoribosyltransferase
MINEILSNAKANRYSADNWVFGSGGGLLQKFDRDTQKFAIKASYGERMVDGNIEGFGINKDPITSSGKRSKRGMLKLHKTADAYMTFSSEDRSDIIFSSYVDDLETVFENGEIVKTQTFEDVRKIANGFLEVELNKNKPVLAKA